MKQYIWASMGDDKVRASHAALDGKVRDWTDSPAPGEESGCRCVAIPASFFDKIEYKPEEDSFYMAGYYTWGQIAALDLKVYDKLIRSEAIAVNSDKSTRQIDPELIKGVITNEVITRLGASGGDAIISGINSLFNDSGNGGTYGPAQLGREARLSAGLTISDSLTYEGAIRGAANWLDKERRDLIKIGIINPTNAQIASRYNMGSAAGAVTKYGVRVQFLIDRLYSK